MSRLPVPLQGQVFIAQADGARFLQGLEERVDLARCPVVVAADEINRRYTNQLGNQTRELGQFASGFALVQEIAGEGDELGLLLPDFFDQLFVVLAEARAVQVAQLDYFEAVEARRQPH